MAIFNVTLKRDFKEVPKGTVLTIVTAGSSVHDTSMIPRALRKKGFADDDFEGITSSAYWDWAETSGDESAIQNDLARYNRRVSQNVSKSKINSIEDYKADKSKTKRNESSKSGIGDTVKKFVVWMLKDSVINNNKLNSMYLELDSEMRHKQSKQGILHKSEMELYHKAISTTGEEAKSIYDQYLKIAEEARDNINLLYFGAKDGSKLVSERDKEIKAHIKDVKALCKAQSLSKTEASANNNPFGRFKRPQSPQDKFSVLKSILGVFGKLFSKFSKK